MDTLVGAAMEASMLSISLSSLGVPGYFWWAMT